MSKTTMSKTTMSKTTMSITTTFIVIGDPHIQVNNFTEVDIFMKKLINLATEKQPDFIVILGDILHTHERLHVLAMNKAYELINNMRLIAKTYILVGNHDMSSNSQFLTENHWLNGMKEWDNTVIVDKVLCETIAGEKYIFAPYVYPGIILMLFLVIYIRIKDHSQIYTILVLLCKMLLVRVRKIL